MFISKKPLMTLVALCTLSVFVNSSDGALVHHWKLDDGTGSGTAADSVSAGGVTGTLTNMDPSTDWITAGLPPVPSGTTAALDFDGVNDYVVTTGYGGIGGANDRSTAFWIKGPTPQPKNHATIISWGVNSTGQRWDIRIAPSPADHMRTEVSGSGTEGTATVADNAWHHVAAVWANDGTPNIADAKFYVDGVLDPNSVSGATAINTSTANSLQIGQSGSITGRQFTGQLDDVRMYDHALSAAEVHALFAPSMTPNDSSVNGNLLVQLTDPANDYSPATGVWTDSSGNGNHTSIVATHQAMNLATATPASGLFAGQTLDVVTTDTDSDLLKTPALNGGAGFSNMTLIALVKYAATLESDRPVGIGSFTGGTATPNLDPAGDGSVRRGPPAIFHSGDRLKRRRRQQRNVEGFLFRR